MDFTFFSASDKALFLRSDAETANWTHEEMSLTALFPYDPDKVIERGMRIGFTDALGVFQPFEIRKVRTYEPDHYQEITAEHIIISELTDEHFAGAEITGKTAQQALTTLLAGTQWQVGTVTATGTSSANFSMTSVWECIRGTLERDWNIYIFPRVTVSGSGITGRYIDVTAAKGTWRGVRLSMDKNADEVGITYDDSMVVTALYGYGRSNGDSGPLKFTDVVWSQTAEHPAKPAGQAYLEDPAATALYGRNGRPRFGFYQNGDITDANVLLQKTWETLQTTNAPTVTIDCLVRDLYRMGYADQPLRLHDTALVEIEPIGVTLALEIIRLSEDLLDETATRPTIGQYIPNIVYINRETAQHASGGGGRGISGRRGGGTASENKISEFETEISANQYEISLRAYQRDMDNVDEILRQAGISIDAQGVITYAEDNVNMLGSKFKVNADAISAEVTNRQNADGALSSLITQTADSISAEVTRATGAENALSSRITINADAITSKVSAGDIASTINQTAQSVLIQASKINLEGYVTATELNAVKATITNLQVNMTVSDTLTAGTVVASNMMFNGTTAAWKQASFGGINATPSKNLHFIGRSSDADQTVTPSDLPHSHSISYNASTGTFTLGGVSQSGGTFNIADTAIYKNAVAAVEVTRFAFGSVTWDATTSKYTVPASVTLSNGNDTNTSASLEFTPTAAINAGEDSVTVSSWGTSQSTGYSNRQYHLYAKVTLSNGKTATHTYNIGDTAAYNAGANSVTIDSITFSRNGNLLTAKATASNGATRSAIYNIS